MNCSEFEKLLESHLDFTPCEELDAAQRHAQGCAKCRALWESITVLHEAIPVWKTAVPDVDLVARVFDRAASPSEDMFTAQPATPATVPTKRVDSALAVMVACLAAVALLLFLPKDQDDEAPTVPIRVVDNETSIPQPLDVLVKEAGGACLDLAQGAVASVTEIAVPADDLWQPLRPRTETHEPTVSDDVTLVDDLRPIGRDVEKAMEFLWQVVPDTNETL